LEVREEESALTFPQQVSIDSICLDWFGFV